MVFLSCLLVGSAPLRYIGASGTVFRFIRNIVPIIK